MEKRIGFIGIVIEDMNSAAKVNRILSTYQDMIEGRLGIPDHETKSAVIGLVVHADAARVGALTGKLGNISGVTVKSAMTNKAKEPILTKERNESNE